MEARRSPDLPPIPLMRISVKEYSQYSTVSTDEVLLSQLCATDNENANFQKFGLIVRKLYPFRSSMTKVIHFAHSNFF